MAKSRLSRAIAIFLSVVMCVTMTTTIGFGAEGGGQPAAGDKDTKNLVVFGNSTSSGYGMPDFLNTNNGFATNNNYLEEWAAEAAGYEQDWTDEKAWTMKAAREWNANHPDRARMSNSAYPWQLKKYIAENENVNVDLTPITMNGMRTDELRAFLDKDYYEEASGREWKYAQKWIDDNGLTGDAADPEKYKGFLNSHLSWYMGDFSDSGAGEPNYDAASQYVKNSIKDADVVVLDLCGNSFGTYMGYRLMAVMGMNDRYRSNTYETINDVEDLPPELRNQITSIVDAAASKTDVLSNPIVRQIFDIFMYSVADCIVNFSADVEMVRELNPDAKIIAVGLNNPMAGLKLEMGDQSVDIGKLAWGLYSVVNTYVKSFDKNANNYFYASIPEETTSFASSIAKAETFEDLFNGSDTYEDGLEQYAIELTYHNFVSDFMGGSEGDYKTIYGIVQDGIKEGMKQAGQPENPDQFCYAFPKWESLQDADKITFSPMSYITVDMDTVNAAQSVNEMMAALSVTGRNPGSDKALTKDKVKVIAAKYRLSQMTADDIAALYSAGLIPAATPEAAYAYILANMTDEGIAQAYGFIQNGIKGVQETAGGFSDLSDSECATFNPVYTVENNRTLYVTVNKQAASLTEAFGVFQGEADPDYLEKKELKGLTDAMVKPKVQQMLWEAVRYHQTLGVDSLMSSLGDMDKTADAIKNYLFAVMTGDSQASMDEGYWALITLEERFLLSDGVGEHPNKEGCDQKYQAVLKAYLSEDTAWDETMAELQAIMAQIKAILDETPVGADLDELMAKINKATELMAVLEGLDLDPEQLQELMVLKDRLADATDVLLDALGLTMEDLYKAAQQATEPENIEKIAAQIEKIRNIIDQLPKTQEEAKAQLLEQLEKVDEILEENALGLSEELLAQLKELNAALKEAVTQEDYNIAVQKLLPIGQKLLAIGQAVAGLPEYEAAMQEYMQLNDEVIAHLKDRVGSLEDLATKLAAKSIDVDIKTKVTFPDHTVMTTVSWATDEDADGYRFTRNGEEVQAADINEANGVKTYEEKDQVIGETYTYEVTPFVIDKNEKQVFGDTFTATVVPKVELSRGKLSKVKKGTTSFKATWKAIKGAEGYQISYKTGKKTQYKTINGGKKLSATVKGLKANKKYTVKVRACKTVNGVKYFGKWSKAKSIKTR